MLFDEATYGDLLTLTGDRGAKGLLERYGGKVRAVEVAGARPVDIDTTKDLEKL